MSMIYFHCVNCSKEFGVYPSRAKKGEVKYCSKECKYTHFKVKETKKRSKIQCEYCGKEFLRYHYRAEKNTSNFCSSKCMGLAKLNKIVAQCECCHKSFEVKESQNKLYPARFCSLSCRKEFYRYDLEGNEIDINRECLECGKHFTPPRDQIRKGRGKFCSRECHFKFKTEDYGPEDIAFYASSTWSKLKKSSRKQFDFTCQCCGKRQKGLHVHHIIPRKKGGKDELDNLIPLCETCHTTIEWKTRRVLKEHKDVTISEMLDLVMKTN